MGQKHKPLATLKLTGSKHAKYGRKNEPVAEPGEPIRPTRLNDDELEVYDQLCDKLRALGVLAIADGYSLERYSVLYVRFWTASEVIRKQGETIVVTDRNGAPKAEELRPESKLTIQLADKLLKLEQEFGLTPSSRAGIKLERQQIEDKAKQKFFG